MEVHHHSHSDDPDMHRSRKKWTHYFWEFFMLFLAVTLGFFVENQREHFVEHSREKQFITTLVEDLKSDTLQLTTTIAYKRSREQMLDSLITHLSRSDYTKYGNDIYFYARNLTRPEYFSPNDRTIQQLKNSGSLRLIRKLSVSDSIMFYDQQLRVLSTLYQDERSIRDSFRELVMSVFDGKVLYSQIDSVDIANYKRPEGNPSLFSRDATLINRLISIAQYLRTVLRGVRIRLETIKKTGAQLLLFLQKEYRLN
jgi:hypothetical protein